MLQYAPDSLSAGLRSVFFRALRHCCTKKAFALFGQALNNYPNDPGLIQTLALCKATGFPAAELLPAIVDTGGKTFLTPEQAFFLERSSAADIPLLARLLPRSKGKAQIYLLKALFRKATRNPSVFSKTVKADSATRLALQLRLRRVLKSNSGWPVHYYALGLSPFIADSSFAGLYSPLLTNKNVHVRLAAWKAYANLLPESFSPSLLSALSAGRKNFYFRAGLLKILARHKPLLAYGLIMKELAEGDSFYKAGLLEALAATRLPHAVATLKQFLQVPDTRLVNRAFESLLDLKRLSAADVRRMLRSPANSSVGTVLDNRLLAKKYVNTALLFELYKKFNSVSGLEVQQSLLSILKERSLEPDSAQIQLLTKYACHPLILRKLALDFSIEIQAPLLSSFPLPPYLLPDSIRAAVQNPQVEIITTRGSILAELYAGLAPLTVQNFLGLAQKKFYNNLTFHRVVPDFVIQGGDPQGDGWGGPGYLVPSEDNPSPFLRGSIGMATAGFDTGGSQFFICQSAQPHLEGNYSLFGKVIRGMEIVDSIVPGDKILEIKIRHN